MSRNGGGGGSSSGDGSHCEQLLVSGGPASSHAMKAPVICVGFWQAGVFRGLLAKSRCFCSSFSSGSVLGHII